MATVSDLTMEGYLVKAQEELILAQQKVKRIQALIESKKPVEPENTDTVTSIDALAGNTSPDYAMQVVADREAEKQRMETELAAREALREAQQR